MFSLCIFVKMDWRRWASIARLSIRKMCCLNGSRKLLTQKIMQIRIVGVRMDFPHEVRFSAGIGPAHFLAETTRPLGRGCLHFHLFVSMTFCFRSIELDAAKIQHFIETTKLSRLFLQYWMKKASRHFSGGLARILGNYFLQCEKIITFHNISKYLIEIITFCYFILEVEQKSTIFAAFIYFGL